jgi:hypothetical protein
MAFCLALHFSRNEPSDDRPHQNEMIFYSFGSKSLWLDYTGNQYILHGIRNFRQANGYCQVRSESKRDSTQLEIMNLWVTSQAVSGSQNIGVSNEGASNEI